MAGHRAQTNEAIAAESMVSCGHAERAPANKAPLSGVLCSFGHVRFPDEAGVQELANRQYGCVHREQLLAAGLGRGAIRHRLATRQAHELLPSVYRVGLEASTQFTAEMAAVLSLRGDAVLGGRSAAAVWCLIDSFPPAVEVTLAGRSAYRRRGVAIHRVRTLSSDELRWRRGLPIISPARTLIELAALLDPWELESAVAQLHRLRLARPREVDAALAACPANTKGIATLRALIAPGRTAADTRSVYERKLLKLIRDAGLPEPVTNIGADGHLVDMMWPRHKLIVEFDSWEFHRDRDSFESDRRRDQDHALAGARTLRITARQLDREPYRLVSLFTSALLTASSALSAETLRSEVHRPSPSSP